MKSGDLDDTPVPVRLKLSALWTPIMFCYIYGDFWGLYRPGNLRGILDGQGPLGPTSQGTLVAVPCFPLNAGTRPPWMAEVPKMQEYFLAASARSTGAGEETGHRGRRREDGFPPSRE